MSTYTVKGLITYKDEHGDLYQLLPVTTLDMVDGSDVLIAHTDRDDNPHDVRLSHLGISVTADEINMLSGVTTNLSDKLTKMEKDITSAVNGGVQASDLDNLAKTLREEHAAMENNFDSKISAHTNEMTTLINTKANKESVATVALPLSGWEETGDFFSQDVSVPGVTSDNTVIASPSTLYMNDYITYASCMVACAEQSENKLKFLCWVKPDRDLHASIAIFNTQ